MRSRVMPGSSVTIERRVPVRRLKSVDFPTFGRPTITMDGSFSVIFVATNSEKRPSEISASLFWKPMDAFVFNHLKQRGDRLRVCKSGRSFAQHRRAPSQARIYPNRVGTQMRITERTGHCTE